MWLTSTKHKLNNTLRGTPANTQTDRGRHRAARSSSLCGKLNWTKLFSHKAINLICALTLYWILNGWMGGVYLLFIPQILTGGKKIQISSMRFTVHYVLRPYIQREHKENSGQQLWFSISSCSLSLKCGLSLSTRNIVFTGRKGNNDAYGRCPS